MDVAVGVRRPVMEDEFLAALRLLAQALIEAELLPALEQLGLALGQPRLHREVGLGQEQRLAPVASGLNLDRFRGDPGDERLGLPCFASSLDLYRLRGDPGDERLRLPRFGLVCRRACGASAWLSARRAWRRASGVRFRLGCGFKLGCLPGRLGCLGFSLGLGLGLGLGGLSA